jgi:type I restriction enzyme, S subunit
MSETVVPLVGELARQPTAEQLVTIPFGDVCININDFADRSRLDGERYLAGEHLDERILVVSRWGCTDDDLFPPTFNRRFTRGDVLLHSRNPAKVVVPGFAGITGEKLFVLRSARADLLDQRFLPYLLLSPQFDTFLRGAMRGSVNKYLNWGALAKWRVTLPPLARQHAALAVLDGYESAVERWNDVAAASRSAHDALAHEVFASGGDVAACGDLCEHITVGIVVRPTQWYVDEGVLALRSLNVFPDRFVLDEVVHISEEGHRKAAKSAVREGDVLVVRTGRPGDAAVAPAALDGANCVDLIVARCGRRMLPEYLSRYLNSRVARRLLAQQTVGTAQQHFNVGSLKKLLVSAPALDVQTDAVRRLVALEDIAAGADRQVRLLRAAMAALLKLTVEHE